MEAEAGVSWAALAEAQPRQEASASVAQHSPTQMEDVAPQQTDPSGLVPDLGARRRQAESSNSTHQQELVLLSPWADPPPPPAFLIPLSLRNEY